jgi:hypothetical protein
LATNDAKATHQPMTSIADAFRSPTHPVQPSTKVRPEPTTADAGAIMDDLFGVTPKKK